MAIVDHPTVIWCLSPGNSCEYLHKPYIARNYIQWARFLLLIVWVHLHQIYTLGSKTKMYSETEWTIAVQGHPRLLILAPIESPLCDFLLVINSNRGSMLYCFWDMTTYWPKNAKFPTHSHLTPSLGMNPFKFLNQPYIAKTRILGLYDGDWQFCYPNLHHFDFWHSDSMWQTDRQTTQWWLTQGSA